VSGSKGSTLEAAGGAFDLIDIPFDTGDFF